MSFAGVFGGVVGQVAGVVEEPATACIRAVEVRGARRGGGLGGRGRWGTSCCRRNGNRQPVGESPDRDIPLDILVHS